MSDTPRTNFVAHATGDAEWDRSINRFGRMMAHACILERELAAAIEQRDTLLVAFDKYGQHLRKCINTKDNSCDCGFISVYYAIRAMKGCK
jgi:hypothetical protein